MPTSAPQYAFGSGVLFGRKTGSSNPTPVMFGALQDVSIDISFTSKALYGQYQFPLAIGRGTAKITGKAKFAQLNAQAFNDLFFGESSLTAGETVTIVREEANVSANTVTVTNNATFAQDLGVVNANTGATLQRVASSPVGTGNYACNESTGVYTFNSAMNGTDVQISYNYTDSGNGQYITINNQLLGTSPQFLVVLTETFNSNKLTLQLNACMADKLTMQTKQEDFMIPEFDFSAFADASQVVGKLSLDAL